MKLYLAIAASSAVLFGSCASPPPAGLSEADRAANEALSQTFVERVLAKDWEGVTNLYTEDAILMPPNMPAVEGRAAIKTFFQSAFSSVTEIEVHGVTTDAQGDLGYGTGSYTMTISIEGMEPIRDEGKFLDVRRKGTDGQWRFSLDMFNSDLPPTAPAPMEESGS